ncbi:hypothetical protein FACS189430_04510 [Bacteroidia bacterium]|nr:hypothetical protein FACS189430_04510 [Bacteroidia bacterium]
MKNIIIIAAIAATTAATAQQSKHEFSLNISGGISTLKASPPPLSGGAGAGGAVGASYTYRISDHWGIGTGIEAALFSGKSTLASLSDSYPSNDSERNFEYHYTLTGYSDRQQAILLNIPLMLHFQTGRFYAALGGKAGIPLSAKFSSSADKLDASGVYPPSTLTLHAPKFMGFGQFTDLSNKGTLALKTAFFASAEAGIRWRLSEKLSLSTGLYVDYGINNIRPTAATPLIDYHANDEYRPNSAIASTNAGKPLADKVKPLAAGIKIGLVFGASPLNPPNADFSAAPETDPAALEAERQRLAEERRAEERRAEERKAEEIRLAEQKRAEEQRLAEEKRLAEARKAEEKRAEEQRLAEVKAKIQQPEDGYTLNGTALSAQQKASLDEKVALLQQFYPDATITIEGHTCNTGTHPVNQTIAQKRADNAKAYLIQKGVAANRITTTPKAETEPLTPNNSEANKEKNRRVVIRLNE